MIIDNKPQKPNLQLNCINIGVKVGLIALLISNGSNYWSFSFYHFITLYSTTCFIILCFFEYRRKNYVLTLTAFIGLIAYQPFYSALRYDVLDDEVRINEIVLQITALTVIPWIIFDFIRWIKDYREFRKIQLGDL
jgi:hypothetical protein